MSTSARHPASCWSEERVARLFELAKSRNYSRSIMADMINREFPKLPHCSRNAVIGKLQRLGLKDDRTKSQQAKSCRPKSGRPVDPDRQAKPRPKRAVVARPKKPVRQIPDGFDYASARMDCFTNVEAKGVDFFLVRSGQCRWPLGDPSDLDTFRFCAEAVESEASWCAHHGALATAHHPSHTGLKRAASGASRAAGKDQRGPRYDIVEAL